MKCSKVRKNLSRYLDNELSETGRLAIELHLKTCADCRNQFAQLESDQKLLKSLPVPEIPPYLNVRTLALIRAPKPAPALPRLVWQTAVSLLLLAGIGLGILLGSGLAQNTNSSPELAALNSEPSIEQIFTLENGGK
jgi:anti-sigma factor RsiW